MVVLLVLAANSGTRTGLFVLLMVAILLILIGAVIAIITMYFYWNARSNKAEGASGADALPGE